MTIGEHRDRDPSPRDRSSGQQRRSIRVSSSSTRTLIEQIDRRSLLRGTISLGALSLLTGCNVTDRGAVRSVLTAVSSWNDLVTGLPVPAQPPGADLFRGASGETAALQRLLRDRAGEAGRRRELEARARRPHPGQAGVDRARRCPRCRSRSSSSVTSASEGWDYIGQWSGVNLRHFLERVGADLTRPDTSRSSARTTTPAASTWRRRCIRRPSLATKYAREPITDPFGFPLRLRTATKLGFRIRSGSTGTLPRGGCQPSASRRPIGGPRLSWTPVGFGCHADGAAATVHGLCRSRHLVAAAKATRICAGGHVIATGR